MFLDKFITGLRYFGGKSSFDVISNFYFGDFRVLVEKSYFGHHLNNITTVYSA